MSSGLSYLWLWTGHFPCHSESWLNTWILSISVPWELQTQCFRVVNSIPLLHNPPPPACSSLTSCLTSGWFVCILRQEKPNSHMVDFMMSAWLFLAMKSSLDAFMLSVDWGLLSYGLAYRLDYRLHRFCFQWWLHVSHLSVDADFKLPWCFLFGSFSGI